MFTEEAIAKIQDAGKRPESLTITHDGKSAPLAFIPPGFEVESLKQYFDAYKTKPDRRSGTVETFDLSSFIAVTNRFKCAASAIFRKARITTTDFSASLRAILNYSPAGEDNKAADFGDHCVGYNFPLSEELKVWLGKNKTAFNAADFSAFLEDNIADLIVVKDGMIPAVRFSDSDAPSFATPSEIFKLSRGIEVRTDEKVSNFFRNNDGSFSLQYTTENKDVDGKPLKLPEWFCLSLRIFEGGENFLIPVRLRFRVKEGQVAWTYDMYRKNEVFDAAFQKACASVVDQTLLPLYNGQA